MRIAVTDNHEAIAVLNCSSQTLGCSSTAIRNRQTAMIWLQQSQTKPCREKSSMKRKLLAALASAAIALGVGAGLVNTSYAAEFTDPAIVKSDPITLTQGHIDMFNLISVAADDMRMVLKEDVTATGTLRTPESVVVSVGESTKMSGVHAYSFLNAVIAEGLTDEMYYLPLSQQADRPWPGWDSMGAASALGITDLNKATADYAITKVEGPGSVYLWSVNTFATATTSVLTSEGYKLPGTIHQPILAHQHINWGFTKAGTYKLTVTATVSETENPTHTLTSESHVYTFQIGAVDKSALNEKIAAADELTQADYTSETWAALSAKLSEAKALSLQSETTQDAVDTATATLDSAIKALVKAEVATPDTDESGSAASESGDGTGEVEGGETESGETGEAGDAGAVGADTGSTGGDEGSAGSTSGGADVSTGGSEGSTATDGNDTDSETSETGEAGETGIGDGSSAGSGDSDSATSGDTSNTGDSGTATETGETVETGGTDSKDESAGNGDADANSDSADSTGDGDDAHADDTQSADTMQSDEESATDINDDESEDKKSAPENATTTDVNSSKQTTDKNVKKLAKTGASVVALLMIAVLAAVGTTVVASVRRCA